MIISPLINIFEGTYEIPPFITRKAVECAGCAKLIEVPTDVATSHDTARHDRHRADNNCLASWRDSETQIKPFYEFERRKKLDGGAVGRVVLLYMKGVSPQQGTKAMTRL